MTISPSLERETGGERIRALLRRGIVPALGHDVDCTEEDILSALRDGCRNFEISKTKNTKIQISVDTSLAENFPLRE